MTPKTILTTLLLDSSVLPFPTLEQQPKMYKKSGQPNKSSMKAHMRQRGAMCKLIAHALCETRHPETMDFVLSTALKTKCGFIKNEYVEFNDIHHVFIKTSKHLSAATVKACNMTLEARSAGWSFTRSFFMSVRYMVRDVLNNTITVDYNKLAKHVAPTQYDAVSYVTPHVGKLQDAILSSEHTLNERLYIWAYLQCVKAHNGRIPLYYRYGHNSSRLYGFGSTNLQNKPKAIRAVILAGYKSYDMNAALFAMMLSLPDVNRKDYPCINEYVRDTIGTRITLLTECNIVSGVTPDSLKQAITSVGFGSNLIWGAFQDKYTYQLADELRKTPTLSGIMLELKTLRKKLFPDALQKRGKKDDKRLTQPQLLSIAAQQQENECLQAMRSVLRNPDNCLMLFDELYTLEEHSTAEFEQVILNKTGIQVGIKS